jgi:hypothetical protein
LHGLPLRDSVHAIGWSDIPTRMAVDVVAFRQAGWERMSYLAMAALLTFEYCELSLCIVIVWIVPTSCSVLQFGNEVRNMNVKRTTCVKTDIVISFVRSNIFG